MGNMGNMRNNSFGKHALVLIIHVISHCTREKHTYTLAVQRLDIQSQIFS